MSTRVKVDSSRSLENVNGTTTLYETGFEGLVPDAHAERLVAAGAAVIVESAEQGRARRRGEVVGDGT